jgi:hypothetical protein
MRRLALVSGVVVAILGIAATPSSAKSTGSGSSTTTASLTVDNDPPFGGSVALSATFAPVKAVPEESVTCTSNGQEVYLNVQTGSGSTGSWTADWTLWSQAWQSAGGGAANCIAELYYYTWQGKSETGITYLASANFAVS